MTKKSDAQINQDVFSESDTRSDSSIVRSIKSALLLDYLVPDQQINVEVNNCHVRLTGNVDWAYQRQAAVIDVLMKAYSGTRDLAAPLDSFSGASCSSLI